MDKKTIDMLNTSDISGNSPFYDTNYQKVKHALACID